MSCRTTRTKSPAVTSSSAEHLLQPFTRRPGVGQRDEGRVRRAGALEPGRLLVDLELAAQLVDALPPLAHAGEGNHGAGGGSGDSVLVAEHRHQPGQRRRIEVVEEALVDALGDEEVALVIQPAERPPLLVSAHPSR